MASLPMPADVSGSQALSPPEETWPSGRGEATDRRRIDTGSLDTERYAVGLAIAVIVLIPIARGWILWRAPAGDEINQWVLMQPFDWPLAMLVVVQGTSWIDGRHLRPPGSGAIRATTRLLWLLVGWLALAALVHPSWRAVALAYLMAGAWAIVRTARTSSRAHQDLMLAAVIAFGAFQAALGVVQSALGRTVGLGPLEVEGTLYAFGDSTAGQGSFIHPYHLTVHLMVGLAAGWSWRPGRRVALAC